MRTQVVTVELLARGDGHDEGGEAQQDERGSEVPRSPALGPTDEESLGE